MPEYVPKSNRFDPEARAFVAQTYLEFGPSKLAYLLDEKVANISYLASKLGLRTKNTPRCNPQILLDPSSDTAAYVLGLLWADGWYTRNGIHIECVSSDMLYFYEVLKEVGGWHTTHRQRAGRQPQSAAGLSSVVLADGLRELGFTSARESISSVWNILPPELRPSFVLGYFDGDGCFYISPSSNHAQFSLTGRTGQDWSIFQQFFSSIDVNTRIHFLKSTTGSQLRVTNKTDIKTIGRHLYAAGLGLPRKKRKWEIIASSIKWTKRRTQSDKTKGMVS